MPVVSPEVGKRILEMLALHMKATAGEESKKGGEERG